MPAPAYADSATEVRFGYTLSNINQLANAAVWRGVFQKSLPLSERLDIAWSAIAEHLSACDRKPEPGELIKAAWRELQVTKWDKSGSLKPHSAHPAGTVVTA